MVREWPIDLTPLADCPQLRRVEMERCAMMRTELAALNAGLLPAALDFLADEPRPLAPLKSFRVGNENKAGEDFFRNRLLEVRKLRDEFYDGDLTRYERRAGRNEGARGGGGGAGKG